MDTEDVHITLWNYFGIVIQNLEFSCFFRFFLLTLLQMHNKLDVRT